MWTPSEHPFDRTPQRSTTTTFDLFIPCPSPYSNTDLQLCLHLLLVTMVRWKTEYCTSWEPRGDSPSSPASCSSSAPLVNRAGGSIYVVEAADCQCSAGGVVSTSSAKINSTQEYASGPFLAQVEEKVFKVWKQGDNKNYILWRNLVGEFKVGYFSEFKTKKKTQKSN